MMVLALAAAEPWCDTAERRFSRSRASSSFFSFGTIFRPNRGGFRGVDDAEVVNLVFCVLAQFSS